MKPAAYRTYYQRNRDALLAQKRDYYQRNRDAILARQKAHREANLEEARARQRTRRSWYVEHGICPNCGQRPIVEGRKSCAECLYKATLHGIEQTEKRRANSRRLYWQRAEAGLCVKCGAPARPDRRLCRDCGEKKRLRTLRRQQPHRRPPRDPALCLWCDRPHAEGTRYCAEHYAQVAERARHAAACRKADHPWRSGRRPEQ